MSFEPRDYLRHIMVEADYLIGEAAGLKLEDFGRGRDASACIRTQHRNHRRGGEESTGGLSGAAPGG